MKRIILSIVVCVLILISAFFYSGALVGICIAIGALLLINSPEYLLPGLYIATFLNENSFIIGTLTTSRFLTIILILVTIITLIDYHEINKKLFMFVFPFLAFIFVSASCSYEGVSGNTISFFMNIFLVLTISRLKYKDIENVFKIIVVSYIGFLICIVFNYISGATVFDNGSFALVEGLNNNNLGMALAQIGAFLISICLVTKTKGLQIIIVFSFVAVDALVIFWCGSRTALFALFCGIIASIFLDMYINEKSLKKGLLYICMSVIGYILINVIVNSNDVLATRFTLQSIKETGGTGRSEIWECVINEIILKHPIFGVGFGSGNIELILNNNGIQHSGTHNLILDMMAQMGIVPSIILLIAFLVLLLRMLLKIRCNAYLAAPFLMLVVAFFNGLGENVFTERFVWIDIGIAVWLLFCSYEKNEVITENDDVLRKSIYEQ